MSKNLTLAEVLDELDIWNDSDSGEEVVDDDDFDPDFDVNNESMYSHDSDTQDVCGDVQGVPNKKLSTSLYIQDGGMQIRS